MLRSAAKLQLICKPGRFVSFRSFSEIVRKKFEVHQGGSLLIDFYKADNAVVEISTAWQDHCDVEYEYDIETWNGFHLNFHEDFKAQKLTLTPTPPAASEDFMPSPIKCLKLTVPEMMNVSIIAHHLDLRVKNKLLGDFIIESSSGTIVVDKLRGTNIIMECPNSDITVNKLLEGSSTIKCKSLAAQMINGEAVSLSATNFINVKAMYSQESSVSAIKGDITVGLMQGNTKVLCDDGDVTMKGIDGSFEIDVTKGNIQLQIGKLVAGVTETVSSAMTVEGDIHATVDPELKAGVLLESFVGEVRILSDAFERKASSLEDPDCIEGFLTGQSKGLKRPTFYREGGHSGKIDKQGAEDQSLHSVTGEVGFPTLRLVATGDIKLETLSWIEAIRRKHITGGLGMPDIPLGKRAAAFQKLLKLQEDSANASVATESVQSLPPVTNTEFLNDEESAKQKVPINRNVVPSGDIVGEDESNATVSLNLDNIPGMQTEGEKYVIMFTCNVCETRSARKISKRGYHHGVVICRCEKCRNLHLIADRMGVFEDESWDIQKHMTKLLDRQNISVSHEADVLEVTIDEEGENEDEESDEEEVSNLDLNQIQKDIERDLGPSPIK